MIYWSIQQVFWKHLDLCNIKYNTNVCGNKGSQVNLPFKRHWQHVILDTFKWLIKVPKASTNWHRVICMLGMVGVLYTLHMPLSLLYSQDYCWGSWLKWWICQNMKLIHQYSHLETIRVRFLNHRTYSNFLDWLKACLRQLHACIKFIQLHVFVNSLSFNNKTLTWHTDRSETTSAKQTYSSKASFYLFSIGEMVVKTFDRAGLN